MLHPQAHDGDEVSSEVGLVVALTMPVRGPGRQRELGWLCACGHGVLANRSRGCNRALGPWPQPQDVWVAKACAAQKPVEDQRCI